MGVVVAIDAGTTGVRALAVDEAGQPVAWSYREFPQHFPRPGWVEHDPMEIWAAVCTTLAELTTGLDQQIAAIGITDQRETAVLWDRRTGAPLAPAIVWQDRRTATRCDQLREQGALPEVRVRTGLVLDPYFSATKVEWLLTEGGVARGPDLAFGTVDSWLLWNLTGGAVHATDPSNASRTLLFDISTLEWSQELCDLFGVPPACLPEVRPSSGRFGKTVAGAGLPAGIPVSGIAGDQQAALFGQTCFTPGMTKNTYGTGSFVLTNTGSTPVRSGAGLISTVAWDIGDGPVYALEGSIFVTGAAIQWLRDGLGVIGAAGETEQLARSLDSNDGVYFVPALTGLGSPHWDPYARGTIVGLTRGSSRAHLARAALEAIAYQTVDAVRAMEDASGVPLPELRADGGGVANGWLMQFQADVLGVPVVVPEITETTALGAAYLAGVATGLWSEDDVRSMWREAARYEPAMSDDERETLLHGWHRALDHAKGWARA